MEKFIRPTEEFEEWFDDNHFDRNKVLSFLLEASKNHCAYTDEIIYGQDATIDNFIPKSELPILAGQHYFNNMFPVSRSLNFKVGKLDNKRLKPDASDYSFEKYFTINYNNGLLFANQNASDEDKERAIITIHILGLNNADLVQKRKKKADYVKENIEYVKTRPIDEFPFRFMVRQILADFAAEAKTGFIEAVAIQNFYCIQNISLENLKNRKEIYFLGENGDGKTLLLQALILLFRARYLKKIAAISDVADALEMLNNLVADTATYGNANITETQNGWWLKNMFGYGVSRNQTHGKSDKHGFLTLFDKETILGNPTNWLFKLTLKERAVDYKGLTSQQAIQLLENLTDNNLKITIDADKILFIERGSEIDFQQLSEGYRMVLIWVTDLVARLSEGKPDFQTITYENGDIGYDFQGVVLVDEINLHLHPKWEYQIVRKLRRWFPNIQFFFTTHSPITVMGASADAVFYRLYKNNGVTQISEPYFAADMDNWLANVLVTSPLFDLDSARVAFFNEKHGADTADDSLTSQIRKAVKAEIAQQKQANGKPYFSRDEIQNLIQKALQNAKKS
ncbi:MAG: hypothetical protein RLZZ292_791 [Bacteroidota bacterium]|jgi:predicted ATPase